MREYTANSEKWEKFNRLAKMMINHLISTGLTRVFLDKINNRELIVNEFHNYIRMHFCKFILY